MWYASGMRACGTEEIRACNRYELTTSRLEPEAERLSLCLQPRHLPFRGGRPLTGADTNKR